MSEKPSFQWHILKDRFPVGVMSQQKFRFNPTATLATLRRRSQLLGEIRKFFEDREFIHVETPLLSRDTVVDRYIEPVVVDGSSVLENDDDESCFFLQTSPEFSMKRLVASGATAIYQLCKAFRKGEAGRHHNPEFTMLEWYRVDDDMTAGMQLLSEFAMHMFQVPTVDRMSYSEAFLKFADVHPLTASIDDLKTVCETNRVDASSYKDELDRDAWLNLIMSEVVEAQLGVTRPVILFHYPASQSALAKVCRSTDGHEVAERFELYVDGVELANGYHELLDADELLRRNESVNSQRVSDGQKLLPSQSEVVEAMRHGLPACSGVAMGVDRLMMVLLEHDSIGDVIAFPIDRA